MRSTARDGWGNKLEFHLSTNYPSFWRIVQREPHLERIVNHGLINRAAMKMPPRPNPFSTMSDYTSWASLTDRSYDARHLPPGKGLPRPPDVDSVVELFARADGDTRECPKSTLLFSYFAQWFTDGFLRSDRSEPRDPRRNESPHEIDLMQLYGLNVAQTRALRLFKGGRLKSEIIGGEEYPPRLCEQGKVKPEFECLRVVRFHELSDPQKDSLFAMGSDTSNLQLGFVLMNVLFLREHNRLAALLQDRHTSWSDDRLFETARNISIAILLKIVVEEYINHLAPYIFKFRIDPPAFGRNESWYRTNWMGIEFNLLYRWHSMVPSGLRVGGQDVTIEQTLWPGASVTGRGLGSYLEEASRQPAGRISLFNTDRALHEAERNSILQAREVGLASYNDYRAICHFPRVTDFSQISGDTRVQEGLRRVYGHVDRIEYYVGLFAEDLRPNSALPPLMGRMVGVDAFSQALTNPLLAPRVYNEHTFSRLGMDVIHETRSLADVVARNVPPRSPGHRVSMLREDWKRVS